VDLFLESVAKNPPVRVPGTAVYMSRTPEGTPLALLHNLKHNKVLHNRVVFLTDLTEEIPHVSRRNRVSVEELGHGFFRVVVRYGFMEDPDIPEVLGTIQDPNLQFLPAETTYFLGKETLFATKHPGMAVWRERIFAVMTRNARSATSFFRLPPNRVVELGAQIEM
jgi:KUP system potassium uptake protein